MKVFLWFKKDLSNIGLKYTVNKNGKVCVITKPSSEIYLKSLVKMGYKFNLVPLLDINYDGQKLWICEGKVGGSALVEALINSRKDNWGDILISFGFQVIDSRGKKGKLWVLHDDRLFNIKNELSKNNIILTESVKGSVSTGYKHSWYFF